MDYFQTTIFPKFDDNKSNFAADHQDDHDQNSGRVPPKQLLKWIGNKQRFAPMIARVFPSTFNSYFEPFLGSGAVLGAMAPKNGVASDILKPLIDMWNILKSEPERLYASYKNYWESYVKNPKETYSRILGSYNNNPNPFDLVFIFRSCYGGVIRFTKKGKMSTPIGPHRPIPPMSFRDRLVLWKNRVQNTTFLHASFENIMSRTGMNNVIYCDLPYVDSQAILYGAQAFKLSTLWDSIAGAKNRGAKVALSIDGHKKSGARVVELNIPEGLFQREVFVEGGSSMLRRLQKTGEVMVGEDVHDRLLLTW